MDVCVPEVVAVGHCCTMKDVTQRIRSQKILDWPDCNTLTEVHSFLGVCGVRTDLGQDFAKHARPW